MRVFDPIYTLIHITTLIDNKGVYHFIIVGFHIWLIHYLHINSHINTFKLPNFYSFKLFNIKMLPKKKKNYPGNYY